MSNTKTNNLKEQIQANNQKSKKTKSTVKKAAIIGAVGVLLVGGYSQVKNSNFKLPVKTYSAQAEELNNEKNWSRAYFETLVSKYMLEHPNMNEEVVRSYLAVYYQDELSKYNPELLYELTGIYEYEELTEEKFMTLVSDTFTELRGNGLNLSVEDVTKFVTIINIDQLAQDNQALLTKIIGNQNASEIINDAFKVTSAIKDYNYRTYEKSYSMKNVIKVSNFIFDKKTSADLQLIEDYANRANNVKGNKMQQDIIIEELMNEIYYSSGDLFDMESGVGFASTIPFGMIINNISYNENRERIISKENLGHLLNHDTLELYLSNIFGLIDRCYTKTLTK